MTTKTKTKKLRPLILLMLLFPFVLEAGEFRKIWDRYMWPVVHTPGHMSLHPMLFRQFGNLTHFPIGENRPYTVINHNNEVRTYTSFGTGNDLVDKNFMGATFLTSMGWIGLDIIKTHEGLLYIENAGVNPKFPHFIDAATDLDGVFTNFGFTGFQRYPDLNTAGYTNFYTTSFGLRKWKQGFSEEIAYYPFPDNYRIIPPIQRQHLHLGLRGKLWVQTNNLVTGLLEFDVENEEWLILDGSNLPISWVTPEWWAAEQAGNATSFAYYQRQGFSDYIGSDPRPIIPIVSAYKNNGYHTDNALLYFNRDTEQWDTIRIDLSKVKELEGIYNQYTISTFQIRSLRKILIFAGPAFTGMASVLPSHFMIFDWDTKTFHPELIVPPDSLFYLEDGWDPQVARIYFANCWTDADGNRGIGLICNTGDFLFYNPNYNSISEQTVETLRPDLWFRNFYPNPVTQSTVTANIMCYVPDITTVTLGLYNFMGKHLLDLTNQFEYEPATATIHISFDLPKTISRGTYFLVVRNGSETRTQAFIVGE